MSEKMTDAFWDDLFGVEVKPLQPGEITVVIVANKRNISQNSARDKIKKLVEQGKLVPVGKRKMENGYPSDAWKVVK